MSEPRDKMIAASTEVSRFLAETDHTPPEQLTNDQLVWRLMHQTAQDAVSRYILRNMPPVLTPRTVELMDEIKRRMEPKP